MHYYSQQCKCGFVYIELIYFRHCCHGKSSPRKKKTMCTVYFVISFREGWYGFRKPQCGDPEHRITLCEIYSIKTDNIDGYIIKVFIDLICFLRWAMWPMGLLFSMPHLLWHVASVYNGHLRGPVTLAPIAERLSVELSLPDFTFRSVAAGIRTPNLPLAGRTL